MLPHFAKTILITEKPSEVPVEATGGAAWGRKSSSSSIGNEDEFVEVFVPEASSDDGQADGFVNKIKKWWSWLYYYIAISVDKVIDLLNDISKDYREIAGQLKREQKEKRHEKLRRAKLGYGSARIRFGEASDPEADTKVRVRILFSFHIVTYIQPFTPKYQYAYSPYLSPYISRSAGKENLLIISFILVTLNV